jgi:cardiolipin synthase
MAQPEQKSVYLSGPVGAALLNLPNAITLCRIALVPVFLVFVSRRDFVNARYLFAFAAISDGLDGAIARWGNCKSQFGAFLDPFADKLLLVSSFVILSAEGLLPKWLLAVVLGRDGFIVCGYFLLGLFLKRRIAVNPNFIGKTGTVLQLACVMGAMLPLSVAVNGWRVVWEALLYSAAALTAISGLMYTYEALLHLRARNLPASGRTGPAESVAPFDA